ncbi:hypothetical protein BH787_gp48 [Gordonia phage GMA4]|uniref:hypothetical protein n=1 Tax=Gordonia phage GMA4 TaxID=1647471 RepID=UPI0006BC5FC1|nr:hypothetical protein BH787_gp48 [Gordonia phage GMA4]AKJ72300.1 hypothetical protein GMA4_25 [Gordonia phage GMA4]
MPYEQMKFGRDRNSAPLRGDASDMTAPQPNPHQQQPQGYAPQPGYAPPQQGYQQPYPPQSYAQPVYQQPVQQAASGAQYVRQQQGHSIIKHILLGWVTMYIYTIYLAVSPNHYFHA